MLINERHLNLMDPEARSYLNDQRRRFLEREGVDAAEGCSAGGLARHLPSYQQDPLQPEGPETSSPSSSS